MPEVLILTGPPGAGKSSVAVALADRYDRVAHIDVDILRHFVTATGYIAPGKPGFERQKELAVRNGCDLARNFLEERFAVILEDVIVSQEEFGQALDRLRQTHAAVHCVTLLPSLAACLTRNAGRKDNRVSPEWIEREYERFEQAERLPGVTLNSTNLTVEVTADRVQAATTSGESLILSAAGA
jgi:tRNA uridine 5-carbamoylmethylation protein Kti12